MKTRLSVLLLSLVVCLYAFTTLSQGEDQKPQLFRVFDIVVKPSMASDYEAAVADYWKLFTEAKCPYPWIAVSFEDYRYLFFSPIANYAQIDEMDKFFGETLIQKIGMERLQAVEKRLNTPSEDSRSYLIYHRPDLSYWPDNPRIKEEEMKYLQWDYWTIQSGKEQECEELFKKFNALFKSKKSPYRYSVWIGDIGTNSPLYCTTQAAKDSVDWHIHNPKMWELAGEEGEALLQKFMALVKKYDQKTGWLRRDLSYMPKEK